MGFADCSHFISRSLIVIGLVVLALLLWRVREAFLLAFAAVLVAIIFSAAAGPVRDWCGLSRGWSLAIAIAAITLLLIGAGWLIGSAVRSQVAELRMTLPQALQNVEQRFGQLIPGDDLLGGSPPAADEGEQGQSDQGGSGFSLIDDLWTQLLSWSRTAIVTITAAILVIIAGIYLAANPDTYRRGLVKLLPKSQHRRTDETMSAIGQALRRWLLAEIVAMIIVGAVAGLGTWAIGLPAPLALGLFAGLTEFVPTVGPIIGAIPALLLAATQGGAAFLWTLALFVAIQQLESNVIAPLLEKRMVSIPPAVFLFSVLAFGLLFGILGVLLAAPLTVAAFVAIDKLYVQDVLDEKTEASASDQTSG
jgi:predicted PurR-regulated permease PerM